MTFGEWADYHRRLFAMRTADEESMVIDWAILFEQAGYSPDELLAASKHLALHGPRCNQRDHVQALSAILRDNREASDRERNIRLQREQAARERREAAPPGSFSLLRGLRNGRP